MAEPAKSGGGGGGFGGGAGGMIFFMFVIAFALYIVATQPGLVGIPGGGSINLGNWFGIGSGASGRSDMPSGFRADQLSPVFKKVRIVSISPARGNEPVMLGLAALSEASTGLTLASWRIEGRSGKQSVSSQGAGAGPEWRLPLTAFALNTKHDRIRVFDAQGLLVDEYSY